MNLGDLDSYDIEETHFFVAGGIEYSLPFEIVKRVNNLLSTHPKDFSSMPTEETDSSEALSIYCVGSDEIPDAQKEMHDIKIGLLMNLVGSLYHWLKTGQEPSRTSFCRDHSDYCEMLVWEAKRRIPQMPSNWRLIELPQLFEDCHLSPEIMSKILSGENLTIQIPTTAPGQLKALLAFLETLQDPKSIAINDQLKSLCRDWLKSQGIFPIEVIDDEEDL